MVAVRGNPTILAGLVKRIGNVRVEAIPMDFDQRLILQKDISILQDGWQIDLGYDFNWYHRGPYSSALAKDAYQMVSGYASAKPRSFVETAVESRFKSFIGWVRTQPDNPGRFENFGSVLYLRKRGFGSDQSYLKILAKSPTLTRAEFDAVWNEVGSVFHID